MALTVKERIPWLQQQKFPRYNTISGSHEITLVLDSTASTDMWQRGVKNGYIKNKIKEHKFEFGQIWLTDTWRKADRDYPYTNHEHNFLSGGSDAFRLSH